MLHVIRTHVARLFAISLIGYVMYQGFMADHHKQIVSDNYKQMMSTYTPIVHADATISAVKKTAPRRVRKVRAKRVKTLPQRAAAIVKTEIKKVATSNSIICMAQVLYFEGRFEPYTGLEAIAATVLNRQEKKYAPTICAVVYQPFQYSWTSDRAKRLVKPPENFLQMAASFIQNRDILEDMYPVTHFHRYDIKPKWSSMLHYRGTYGLHRFYS